MVNRRDVLKVAAVAAGAMALRARADGDEIIYVDAGGGADGNTGGPDRPLRTLAEAARRVNAGGGTGAVTVVLAEGVYAVGETTVLKPERRAFTAAARLTIRAAVLPDDPAWHIGRMPTLIHTMPIPHEWNGNPDPLGGAANGLLVETSHVTIQGLKILGIPAVETPQAGLKRRLYAIARLRRDLEDLEVAQCVFLSDHDIASLHVGVIAHGNGVVVRNCIFRGYTKDAVVYWTPGSTGHAMRHCIFHGMYSSTVWTAGIAADFDYRNNVVDGATYVWIYQSGASAQADASGRPVQATEAGRLSAPVAPTRYRVIDSFFAHNEKVAGTGTGARIEFADIDASFLQLSGTVQSAEAVVFEHDATARGYLHPVSGSPAARAGAGLFTRPVA